VTVGEGEKARKYGYYLEAIPADFGVAFRLTKLEHQVEAGMPDHYHVHLDPRGRHSCECLGHLRHGHKTVCRHVAACVALVANGKLPGKPATPAPEVAKSCRCTACHVNLVDAEGGEDTCHDCLSRQ
jgi:hypothetical protein